MPNLPVYTLGQLGINRVRSPIQIQDGELLNCQNASTQPVRKQLALVKRDGMAKINGTAAGGSLLHISNLPFVDPGVLAFGNDWTLRTAAANTDYQGLAYSPSLNLIVVTAGSGTGMTSPDGINWTSMNLPNTNNWYSVAWSPTLNLFASGHNTFADFTEQIMTSPDGSNWTIRTTPGGANGLLSVHDIIWAEGLGLFVAAGTSNSGKPCVMTSPDGINWTLRTTPSRNIDRLAWSEDLTLLAAVTGGTPGNTILTSPDGITWTSVSIPDGIWQDIAWSSSIGLFAAVASNLTTEGDRILTSPDGVTWTPRTPPSVKSWVSINGDSNIFVALSGANLNDVAMISSDGITWTEEAIAASGTWNRVIWISELGLFVTIKGNSTALNLKVMTSP